MRKRAMVWAGVYLAFAAAIIAYELSIRIHDTAHSEFAGMLSMLVALPSSVVMAYLAPAAFGVRVGDSNNSFVVILGLAALLNAVVLFLLLSRKRRNS